MLLSGAASSTTFLTIGRPARESQARPGRLTKASLVPHRTVTPAGSPLSFWPQQSVTAVESNSARGTTPVAGPIDRREPHQLQVKLFSQPQRDGSQAVRKQSRPWRVAVSGGQMPITLVLAGPTHQVPKADKPPRAETLFSQSPRNLNLRAPESAGERGHHPADSTLPNKVPPPDVNDMPWHLVFGN
jgi:hypothetical protein